MTEKLWSHRAAQAGDQIPRDEQEALSRRYGSAIVVLLPLSSGAWATFGAGRQLIAITEGLPQEQDLRRWSLEGEVATRKAQEALQKRSEPPKAEDIGL